jgi:hypothetical protein
MVWYDMATSRHIQRCRILVHVVNGDSPDPVGDYKAINQARPSSSPPELKQTLKHSPPSFLPSFPPSVPHGQGARGLMTHSVGVVGVMVIVDGGLIERGGAAVLGLC